MKFKTLAIGNSRDLMFGIAPHPVKTRRGLLIGGGMVYPELNFTVPPGAPIDRKTLPELRDKYAAAVREALERALHLDAEGLVIEFETLLEMTLDPFIGTELTKAMNEVCEEYFQKYGLKSEIRLTPNDTRDFDRPPLMRSSRHLEGMFKLFEDGAAAGGDLLSIESTGGKEVCDDALLNCDIRQVVFALSVLGVRDMKFLWGKIAGIGKRQGKILGGDTACGFGNTAMVLAEKQYIPRIFAAVVRAVSAVRSLVAIEEGAIGPDKDCAYEGVYLKAIAGIPISMEGKTAACAHLSPLGNVAAACADLWSNESVQNIKLLGGMAPTVYFEQLQYDARLMNTASASGSKGAAQLQKWLVDSDVCHDPQALILAPDSVVAISKEIVSAENYIDASVRAGLKALSIIDEAIAAGYLKSSERENVWIERLREELQSIPGDENRFVAEMQPLLDTEKVILSEYGL
ncbi:MAG: methanol--corrinoid methyltransferase [Lentisphaerae bacterium GWF2_52_8]|nr:MAG: methanol--corrinoid methyltransferase [Lentisphaerae bacterium GWF2_52_8]